LRFHSACPFWKVATRLHTSFGMPISVCTLWLSPSSHAHFGKLLQGCTPHSALRAIIRHRMRMPISVRIPIPEKLLRACIPHSVLRATIRHRMRMPILGSCYKVAQLIDSLCVGVYMCRSSSAVCSPEHEILGMHAQFGSHAHSVLESCYKVAYLIRHAHFGVYRLVDSPKPVECTSNR